MVEKSIKLSSKNATPAQIINQLLASKSLARRNKKGVSRSRKSSDEDLSEDLSDISDTEVSGYISNRKEFLLKKIAWEMMNPEYQKVKRSKPTAVKKKDPVNKIAPGKKTSATRTESNPESESKKRREVEIDFDLLDELLDTENTSKKAKLEKPVVVDDQIKCSEQRSEESALEPQGSEEEEEEEELDWNKDYSNEDAYEEAGEFYGDDEDQDEGV